MTTYTTETIDALNPKLLRVAGAPGPRGHFYRNHASARRRYLFVI